MAANPLENIKSETDLIDLLSKILGERDTISEELIEKSKSIKDWNLILEHKKLLNQTLQKDISIQAALLDYILSKEQRISDTKGIELSVSQKVPYTSIIDSVTGLYNDRHFQMILDAEIKKAKQFTLPLTLLLLDLDNFGEYMSLYGHETGDIALNETALILKKNCRKEDMIFRLKKNRFATILFNISTEGAHKLGERLREKIEIYHFKGEEKLPTKRITVSGGIAIYPEDGKNSHTLILASEEALTTAKDSGKNRVLEFSIKRRKSPRINIQIDAKYQIEGRKDIKAQSVYIKNISESGTLVEASEDLHLGGRIQLTIKLPNNKVIKPVGETVRISRKEGTRGMNIAIKFVDISPADLLNLRNFIEQELSKIH